MVSPLEQLGYQELQYLLVCYCPSVQSKKDITIIKAKVQTGGFSLVSAEQETGNSERLCLDLGRVQSQRGCIGVELERHVTGPWW